MIEPVARATLGTIPTRRGRILMLGLLFFACGGRAQRADTGAGTAGGASGGAGLGGSDAGAGSQSAGTDGGSPARAGAGGGGSAAQGTSGQAAVAMAGNAAAGAPADATTSVGDFDHPLPGLDNLPTYSSSFFWGSPDTGVRLGNWFVTGADGDLHDAVIDAVDPPRGDSTLACRVNGAAFADAVDLYAQLDHPSSRPVDLSAYSGLSFWARLNPPTAKLVVALNVDGVALLSEASVTGLVSGSFLATADWQRFELPFGDAARTSSVRSIDFVVLRGGEALDLWIDELSLCRGACP
jgi:hypothetical protein